MNLQDQCATLEQCKRLKELGVDQSSVWMWVFPANEYMISSNKGLHYHELAKEIIEGNEGNEFDHDSVAAFTVAELGVMLPDGFDSMHCTDEGWRAYDLDGIDKPFGSVFPTEAQARAGMLIYLLENNLTTASECTKRLTT